MHGPEVAIAINAIVWPFIATIVFFYLYFSHRTKVRMALIESGRDASIFRRNTVDRLRSLKHGIVALMAGLGLLFGGFFDAVGMDDDVAYLAGVLLFVGVGLVFFYFYVSRTGEVREEESDIL
jgi:hypothetical protein